MPTMLAYCREGFEKSLVEDWQIDLEKARFETFSAYALIDEIDNKNAEKLLQNFSPLQDSFSTQHEPVTSLEKLTESLLILETLHALLKGAHTVDSGSNIRIQTRAELARFAKKFTGALNNASKKIHDLQNSANGSYQAPWLHIFLLVTIMQYWLSARTISSVSKMESYA